jgi:hypothetical protein
MIPTVFSDPIFLPKRPLMRKPTSGNNRTNGSKVEIMLEMTEEIGC